MIIIYEADEEEFWDESIYEVLSSLRLVCLDHTTFSLFLCATS